MKSGIDATQTMSSYSVTVSSVSVSKFFIVVLCLASMLLVTSQAPQSNLSLSAFLNVLSAVLLGFLYRRSPFLFPVLALYSYVLYSILIGRYLHPGLAEKINSIIDYSYDAEAIILVASTTLLLALLLKNPATFKASDKMLSGNRSRRNFILSFVCLCIGVAIQLLFIDSANTVHGGRASYSSTYEYGVIFYIFAFYFALGYPRSVLLFIGLVALLFAFRDFSLGHRATGIQLILACYIFIFSKFYSWQRFLMACVGGTFLMAFVALYRGTWSYSESAFLLLDSVTQKYFAFDTAYFAYVASLTFIAVRDQLHSASMLGCSG